MDRVPESPRTHQTWHISISGRELALPIILLSPNLAISLFMIIDHGISLGTHIGQQLAAQLSPLNPEIIVGPATLGIPIVIEVSRALKLDQYVILQKSPKVHLADALEQRIESITSKGEQRLLLDRMAVPLLEGKRVVVVDDVVASGSSLKGSLELIRRAGGTVVGVGVVLTEGWEWEKVLGEDDGSLIRSLGHIPQFELGERGEWKPIVGT